MKTKLAITILFFVYQFGQPAFSQKLIGRYDCGIWLNQKSETSKSWLLGYMSGLNTMYVNSGLSGKKDLLEAISADQIYIWMNNYCQKNPLKTLDAGAISLFVEIGKSQ